MPLHIVLRPFDLLARGQGIPESLTASGSALEDEPLPRGRPMNSVEVRGLPAGPAVAEVLGEHEPVDGRVEPWLSQQTFDGWREHESRAHLDPEEGLDPEWVPAAEEKVSIGVPQDYGEGAVHLVDERGAPFEIGLKQAGSRGDRLTVGGPIENQTPSTIPGSDASGAGRCRQPQPAPLSARLEVEARNPGRPGNRSTGRAQG